MNSEHFFVTEEIIPPNKKRSKLFYLKYLAIITVGIFAVIGFGFTFFSLGKISTRPNTQITSTPTSNLETAPENSPTPILTSQSPATPSSKIKQSPTPFKPSKSKILKSQPLLDGFRTSNLGGDNSTDIRAGRNENLITRGFLSFAIDEIPSESIILEARLKLYQVRVVGKPYSNLGNLLIDHLTFGNTLDANDYSIPALILDFKTLSDNESIGWKEVDVTPLLKDDIANARSNSQFRIHFEKEVKGGGVSGDFVYFESANNSEGTNNLPQLLVKYY